MQQWDFGDRFIFDDPRYEALAAEGAAKYRMGTPFNHMAFDNFLPLDVAEAMLAEFPKAQDIEWHNYNRPAEQKLVCVDETKFGPATRSMLYQFNSAPFLRFLEKVTGIDNMISDPSMRGGGLHQTPKGGLLKLHADFNKHDANFLDRRINVIFYMNKNWKEEYGGSLELWDQEVTKCEVKILPVFNRLAIFSPTSKTFHGHPDPLTCPDGDSRKSLALFYYTNGRPANETNQSHTTIFAERPHESIGGMRWRVSQDYMPPVLFRAMRRFRERHLANTIQKRG
ncbi:MAG TPA: proline hydroxylase [Hydrogenophaga sp.]|uniref:2OG-Fe(II) oxygenase n=1 Tax=Hydrogenophaga sp. TaxID=1904254 RepID=UPI0008C10129|nr:2OG-Fe(II) oxygenase [Hydrogenophaga sp.]OGA75329.1 MAG: hypothetical protein A2X73_02930 [Burkholderiales bacterium GWE1_65_30]OGA93461.1 MAG: hypothetical protein A2X72_20505 [Burkholderiales bacterium GWF1_66_17]HAX19476.1 proline hydroxylase [Hydrogenophaga sp.]HBU17792.1 proline hydroxylase [Hydrogenophaga sp.]